MIRIILLITVTSASRCNWIYNETTRTATVNSTSVRGYINSSSGEVCFVKPLCKASRRWAYLQDTLCSQVEDTKGHLIPRFLTGPAYGINCIPQSVSEQERFSRFESKALSAKSGCYYFNRNNNSLVFCSDDVCHSEVISTNGIRCQQLSTLLLFTYISVNLSLLLSSL